METINILLLGNGIIQEYTPHFSVPVHVSNLAIKEYSTAPHEFESYFETKIRKYPEPNMVILYYGCHGKEESYLKEIPERLVENIENILEKIQDEFPEALVVYLSILKYPGRFEFFSQIDRVNTSVRNFSKKVRSGNKGPSRIQFIDLNRIFRANSDYFEEKGELLNALGYEKMNEILLKHLF